MRTNAKKRIGTNHKVTVQQNGGIPADNACRRLIRQAVIATLKSEGAGLPCVVNTVITDDNGIREINKKHRGIDRATDVLSFPMQDFREAGWSGMTRPDIDMDTQTLPLGDIVISTATIKRRARRHGCTFEQETALMMIHAVLHLLGYDHGDAMRKREEKLLADMGCLRVEN